MGIGQWIQNTLADLSSFINSAGGYVPPASQYRDPAMAQREQAPAQAQYGVTPPMVQGALAGMNYIRNNFVSRPISTAFLVAGESSEQQGAKTGDLFSASVWNRAWDAAQRISPGQALGLNPDQGEYTKAMNSPLTYYKPADSLLPQGFGQLPMAQQNQLLQQAGMPAVGNQFIEQKRLDSSLFKYGSGTADFAFSWYADPVVVGGKIAGRAKNLLVEPGEGGLLKSSLFPETTPLTRPVPTLPQRAVGAAQEATLGKLPVVGRAFTAPQAGWTAANINSLVNSSRMGKLQDFLWENRDNPQLLNNLQMAQRSALGPKFGAIVSNLQTPEEMNLFIRSGMGDQEAITQLQMENAIIRSMIQTDQARLSTLGLQRDVLASSDPARAALIEQRMGMVQDGINANQDTVNRYNQMLNHSNEIDNLRDNSFSMARAEARTAAQNAYQAGPARQPLSGLGNVPVLGPAIASSRIANKFFATPLTVVRSFSNYRPHGWIQTDSLDQTSINELRGFVSRIPNMAPEAKQNVINSYIQAADEGERLDILQNVGKLGMAKVAAKYGMTPEYGEELYNADRQKLGIMQDNLKQYASARVNQGDAQAPVRVDAFTDDGGAISIHPNLVTRLVNSHIMPNLDRYDQVLNRNSGALQALHVAAGNVYDGVKNGADYFQHLWKFGTLLRLGYIPRVLGDDISGQIARLGMASMALRAGYGVKNAATNLSTMMLKPYYEASAETSRIGIQYATDEILHVKAEIQREAGVHAMYIKAGSKEYNRAQGQLTAAQKQLDLVSSDPNAIPQRVQQLQDLVDQRQQTLGSMPKGVGVVPQARLQRLQDMKDHMQFLMDSRIQLQRNMAAARAATEKVAQGQQMITVNGIALPGALQGTRGQYYQQLLSPDQSLANIFNTNKQLINGSLMRSWDHGATQVYAPANEALHGTAWAHIINTHMGQDLAARRVITEIAGGQGDPEASALGLMSWFKTPEGAAYRQRLGLKNIDDEQVAQSIAHDVHETIPLPGIAAKALTTDGVTPSFLKSAIPNPAERPDAIAPAIGVNYTQMRYNRIIDRVMQHWFDTVAELPAKTLARHPLFNQLYEGHAKAIMNQEADQGVVHTAADAERIAETARRLAVGDTKRLVFDISHKSDAMAALGFVAPFFAATAEGWQRWSRIVADRPEAVGYAGKFFNAPMSWGIMQDSQGNTVDNAGQVWDPSQKKMVDVPTADRYIVARIPSFIANNPAWQYSLGLALHQGQGGQIKLSQESMNLVLSGDPWFNPGQGPLVTIPLNEIVKDKPELGMMARQIGAMPYGPSSNPTLQGRITDQFLPSTIKDFLSAYNTSDSRYQQVKLQLMQQAAFDHANFGAPMPSASQIATRVRNYWLFSAASAFLGPVSGTKTVDAYGFYRQQYNNLLRNNPQTADQEFLSRYGESYFVFAQQQSKNLSGAAATNNAVKLEQKYGDLIAKYPDLAPLIIGPEGNGPFSPEAYTYELNNPIVPGGSEMMRTKMTAEQAMAENQKRLGWAKYTGFMNGLQATLISRGLQSFNQPGAKDLKALKGAYISMLGDPMLPDGSQNPFYNDAWSKDFNSYDKLKTDRLVSGMEQLVQDPSLMNNPARTDLQVLKQYLTVRNAMTTLLEQRKKQGGSNSLTTLNGSNNDLRDAWLANVGAMVESDVNFGNLYHRYLSKDLGVDALTPTMQAQLDAYNQQQTLAANQGA